MSKFAAALRVARRWAGAATIIVLAALTGCGPTPPKVVLDPPREAAVTWHDKRLFHTPQAFIYARSDLAAGEADRWLTEVKNYIRRKYGRELDKGVVVVMERQDEPIVRSLDEELALERDPALMVTKPRHLKPAAEIRQKMSENGIPEQPSVRASTIPLTPERLRQVGLVVPGAAWAVAAPSHELAVACGVDVIAAGLKKQRPSLTDEQARKAAEMFPGLAAKSFEAPRGGPVFVVWAQRQSAWSDEQRRRAILEYLRHIFRSNGLPVSSDEELEW